MKEEGKSRTNVPGERGASARAIQAHYDVGNDFYSLWLDPTLTYSCAMFADPTEDLESAQIRKLDHHIRASRAAGQHAVLDIGCGWGSCVRRLVEKHGVSRAVGLTLSRAQAEWCEAHPVEGAEVLLESWAQHRPERPYDAIISIGAFEHFCRPEHTSEERAAIYRDFFRRCHELVKPGGWMSLQTQVYSRVEYTEHSPLSQVFPESDMPRLHELVAGFDRLFEPEVIQNHASDYKKTVQCWLENLNLHKEEAIAVSGEDVFRRFHRFLEGGVTGYSARVFLLLRMGLRRLDPIGL